MIKDALLKVGIKCGADGKPMLYNDHYLVLIKESKNIIGETILRVRPEQVEKVK